MVQAKKGDLVRMEYTGRLASNGAVFDTTDESVAREAGILRQNAAYGPKLAAFGTNTVMLGLEEAIISSTLGKTEEFTIKPEKAFGNKDPSLVRMMPERDFAKQQLRPFPGLVVSLDGVAARVKSVNSGRVTVDFNHPLAGEPVVYALNVSELINEPRAKISALLESLGVKGEISGNGEGLTVSFGKGEDEKRVQAVKNAIDVIVPGTTYKTA